MSDHLQLLDQSSQAFILQLYRQWYGLPRKSTQAWLDVARLALAQKLSQDEPIDAVRSFVEDAATRPGVAEIAGEALAAVESSLRSPIFARLTPEGIDALIVLLNVEAPVTYAFGRWVYLPGHAAETLANVRSRLNDDVLARLPAATRGEIDTIFSTLDAAPAEMAGPRIHAMVPTLESLEANPAVLRIAWREMLAGKAETAPETLGVGDLATGISQSLVVHESFAGVESPMPQETRFHTEVRFPGRVKPDVEEALTVRLALDKVEASRLHEVVDVLFADPAVPELVDVVLDAPGFQERFDLWHRTMVVHSDRDSGPVTFLLTAERPPPTASRGPQQRSIKVSFYHKGKYIGEGSFVVEVGADVQRSAGNVKLDEDTAAVELRLVDLPPPADLELRVTHDRRSQELHFMLHSTKAAVGYHWRPMGSVPLLEGEPQRYFSRQLAQLNEWSGLLSDDLYEGEKADFTRKMETMGEKLFEKLFSPELQEAYWRDIRPKQQADVIQSLLITSDEPWIPWELVKPYRYDEVADEEYVDDFLAGSYQISRWLTGHGPYERVTVDVAAIIAPDVGLFHASGEADYLNGLSQHGVAVDEALRTKADVIDVLQVGRTRLLHVASHAEFDAEHPGASPIVLDDDDLLPDDLGREVIRHWRTAKPLIFFNACETGRIAYELTGLGGWADKFIRDVRATAFLGTLWKVNDALAAEFARVFYNELLAGKPLGAACHAARLHIRELAPANPTWLAYTLYGDPNTIVEWGSMDSSDY